METRNNRTRYLFLAGIVFLCMLFTLKIQAAVTVGVPAVTGKASGSMVTLTWNKVPNAKGYQILMYQEKSKSFKYLTSVWTAGNVSWTRKCGTNGIFKFKVKAVRDYQGKRYYGNATAPVTVKTAISPGPDLTFGRWETFNSQKCIRLHWKKNTLADGYLVFRSKTRDSGYTCVATIKGNGTAAWRDFKADINTVWYYRVKAYRNNTGSIVYGSLGNPRKVAAAGTVVVPTASKVLFVGDSRTDAMEVYIGDNSRLNWYGKSGEGLRWLQNTAESVIERELDGKTDLFIWLGVNDTYAVQLYSRYYETMVPRWKAAGAKVYLVAVGPENLTAFGREDTTEDIVSFNAGLKTCAEKTGAIYLDLYTYMVRSGYVTLDGSHYDYATCLKIYEFLKPYFV